MFFSEEEEMYMLWLAYNEEREARAFDEEAEEPLPSEEEHTGAKDPNGDQETNESR